MRYSVIYSTKTGNTGLLAHEIRKTLDIQGIECAYFGITDVFLENSEVNLEIISKSDFIFVGFWTNRGLCDSNTSNLLELLNGKKVFLFGTAGFGGSEQYFKQVIDNIVLTFRVSAKNNLVGSFMCQGKMPDNVLLKYNLLLKENPEKQSVALMIDNFKNALSHPDEGDLLAFKEVLTRALFDNREAG